MKRFDVVAESGENTVLSEYTPEPRTETSHQTEAELEEDFIRRLAALGYECPVFHDFAGLKANLREKIEALNDYPFTDSEWERFFTAYLANKNEGLAEKTETIQNDCVKAFRLDSGPTKNIKLLDKEQIHRNALQVVHQYRTADGAHRYDVTVLVNGLPLVHIELKRRGVALREAFNQIERYSRDSFWGDSGLFEFVQIFVISNGTETKYYSNTARQGIGQNAGAKKSGSSFDFTSYWADAKNRTIPDLADFTQTFFAKHTLLNILTKYCVFTSEKALLVMRPYQIAATERILNRIEIANNYKRYGTTEGGGYIWHTTGSGKTLTSFKTARLAARLEYIDKVLFVVDRKDLDYQTMREYDRFEKGAADSNTSTAVLKRQLEDPGKKILITTIQKFSTFVRKNPAHEVYAKHFVIIFDECHRSQFGEMHAAITKHFKKYHIFGFTGTPIFPENSVGSSALRTTEQTFGDRLHSYTIVDAIRDKNVLPFRVDYISTMDKEKDIEDYKVRGIDKESAYLAPERIEMITRYILEHFGQKTYRNGQFYSHSAVANVSEVASAKNRAKANEKKEQRRISGFNSIFAVSSIEAAKLYYAEFQKQMRERPELALKVAIIFSCAENEETGSGILEEENPEDTSGLDASSRSFLESAIGDYNRMFGTAYDTSSDKFQNYYKDVSMRVKNREVDLLIVVNMFLTGFDATTLNTLWVDKNLRMHGLIQAYSRTNRILNSIKNFGNIVCFRSLRRNTDEALSLFGDKDAGGVIIIRGFDDYYNGYEDAKGWHDGYKQMVDSLTKRFPLDNFQTDGEECEKDFIALIGNILRMRNLLSSFDKFAGKEILSERDFQDYLGRYQDLRDDWARRRKEGTLANIDDDVVFEIELIEQLDINIDYILHLVAQYHSGHCRDKELLIKIQKAVNSSPELRSKKDLIENFIDELHDDDDVGVKWPEYVAREREKALRKIIEEERLNPEETGKFIEKSFREGTVKSYGTDIDRILPKVSLFNGGRRASIKEAVIQKLRVFFERFYTIS